MCVMIKIYFGIGLKLALWLASYVYLLSIFFCITVHPSRGLVLSQVLQAHTPRLSSRLKKKQMQ